MRALAIETTVDRVITAPPREAAFIYFWTISFSLSKKCRLPLFLTIKTLSISFPFRLKAFSSCSHSLLKSRTALGFSFVNSVLNLLAQAAAPFLLANFLVSLFPYLCSFVYFLYFPRVPLASPILFLMVKLSTAPRLENEVAVRFVFINKD